MTIPLQFASLYDSQEVFVWSDCLLDLGMVPVGKIICNNSNIILVANSVYIKDDYRGGMQSVNHSYVIFHVTNEEVRAKIQQAIGPREDLLTIVKRRKLQWYDHVSHSSGPAKTILQGTVKGGRRQGGRRKR